MNRQTPARLHHRVEQAQEEKAHAQQFIERFARWYTPGSIALARRTVRNLRQNVAIALATVTLLLAGVLFGGVTMAPGMLVHQASVLVVSGNGMRLLRVRRTIVSHERRDQVTGENWSRAEVRRRPRGRRPFGRLRRYRREAGERRWRRSGG